MTDARHIRNFVIISHIDHGKSTLADRFLELTGTIERRKMRAQFLDQMDLEREKGITIKMQPVRMIWKPNHAEIQNPKFESRNKSKIQNPKLTSDFGFRASDFEFSDSEFILNLIDTPGHADFAYEVSRALAAVEGAILLVDATQGVQAQTIANFHLAEREGLFIIPVINKIDLDGARVSEAEDEMVSLFGCRREDILKISAKTGEGMQNVLDAVVSRVPDAGASRHSGGEYSRARALIFDSHFDSFRGIIAHVRIFGGSLKRGDAVSMLQTRERAEIIELGHFLPALSPAPSLGEGEIGYVATGLKEPETIRVGDTLVGAPTGAGGESAEAAPEPLPGYREPQPVVFSSLYPDNQDDYDKLRDALRKVQLNDAAVVFEPESSEALGRGFRVGFLGMLHMEIVGERLKREYGMHLIITSPSVLYEIRRQGGSAENVYSASRFPDRAQGMEMREPWVRLEIVTPQKFLGGVMRLLETTRGKYAEQLYLGQERLALIYEVPLKDILIEFSDSLKSISEGYASFSYDAIDYRPGDLVRMDVLVAGRQEESLSQVVPRDNGYRVGKDMVSRLKELLPRQLFPVALQASIEHRVIARETIPAMKKDVTGYLYGGDRTRKMKLWKKQQRGKKRLQEAGAGRVEIPSDVFRKILRREEG